MNRHVLTPILQPVNRLYDEITRFVPNETAHLQFRSDLAGLLVVAMSASYENCVKEILVSYCNGHHAKFGEFASNQYEKLNSRVAIKDLNRYCKLLDPAINVRFRSNLSVVSRSIERRTGKNISTLYQQILDWRHQYAHSRIQNTTVEEAFSAHIFGKRVIYAFADSF